MNPIFKECEGLVVETHTVQYDEPFVRQRDNIERSLLSL